MAGLSTYLSNALINEVLNKGAYTAPTTVYIALFTADPGLTGTANEVSGGSYARQSCSFNTASSQASSNSTAVSYTNMPAATVTYVGVFDAATSGNFLWGGALTASKTTTAGDTFQIPAGSLTVSLT